MIGELRFRSLGEPLGASRGNRRRRPLATAFKKLYKNPLGLKTQLGNKFNFQKLQEKCVHKEYECREYECMNSESECKCECELRVRGRVRRLNSLQIRECNCESESEYTTNTNAANANAWIPRENANANTNCECEGACEGADSAHANVRVANV